MITCMEEFDCFNCFQTDEKVPQPYLVAVVVSYSHVEVWSSDKCTGCRAVRKV
jgi:hypothetical protein